MPRAVGRPDVATLVTAYVDDNESIPALAVQFGVAPQTVHNWLVAAGVPRRPNAVTPRRDVDDDEIRRLYCEEHRSGAEISKLLGWQRRSRVLPSRPPRHRASLPGCAASGSV